MPAMGPEYLMLREEEAGLPWTSVDVILINMTSIIKVSAVTNATIITVANVE
jgi:hypothetical protein